MKLVEMGYKHIRFYGGFGYLECLFAERIVEQG